MPYHSYTRCWLHVVWATLDRRPLLPKSVAAKLSGYLTSYACEKEIYIKINFVNADHVHALVVCPRAWRLTKSRSCSKAVRRIG